jgi:hypothetical protein
VIVARKDTGSGYDGFSWLDTISESGTTTVTQGDGESVSIEQDARYQFEAYTVAPNRDRDSVRRPIGYGNKGNVFFTDDFASGDQSSWDNTGGTVKSSLSNEFSVGDSTQTPTVGGYALELVRGDTASTSVGDLSGESDVFIEARIQLASNDNDTEAGLIDFYDGSSWQTLETYGWEYDGQGWFDVSFTVPDSWLSTDNRIRVQHNQGGGGDYMAVDRVVVSDHLHEYTEPSEPTLDSLSTPNRGEITAEWTVTGDLVDENPRTPSELNWYKPGSSQNKVFETSSPYTITGLANDQEYNVHVHNKYRQYRRGSLDAQFLVTSNEESIVTITPASASLTATSSADASSAGSGVDDGTATASASNQLLELVDGAQAIAGTAAVGTDSTMTTSAPTADTAESAITAGAGATDAAGAGSALEVGRTASSATTDTGGSSDTLDLARTTAIGSTDAASSTDGSEIAVGDATGVVDTVGASDTIEAGTATAVGTTDASGATAALSAPAPTAGSATTGASASATGDAELVGTSAQSATTVAGIADTLESAITLSSATTDTAGSTDAGAFARTTTVSATDTTAVGAATELATGTSNALTETSASAGSTDQSVFTASNVTDITGASSVVETAGQTSSGIVGELAESGGVATTLSLATRQAAADTTAVGAATELATGTSNALTETSASAGSINQLVFTASSVTDIIGTSSVVETARQTSSDILADLAESGAVATTLSLATRQAAADIAGTSEITTTAVTSGTGLTDLVGLGETLDGASVTAGTGMSAEATVGTVSIQAIQTNTTTTESTATGEAVELARTAGLGLTDIAAVPETTETAILETQSLTEGIGAADGVEQPVTASLTTVDTTGTSTVEASVGITQTQSTTALGASSDTTETPVTAGTGLTDLVGLSETLEGPSTSADAGVRDLASTASIAEQAIQTNTTTTESTATGEAVELARTTGLGLTDIAGISPTLEQGVTASTAQVDTTGTGTGQSELDVPTRQGIVTTVDTGEAVSVPITTATSATDIAELSATVSGTIATQSSTTLTAIAGVAPTLETAVLSEQSAVEATGSVEIVTTPVTQIQQALELADGAQAITGTMTIDSDQTATEATATGESIEQFTSTRSVTVDTAPVVDTPETLVLPTALATVDTFGAGIARDLLTQTGSVVPTAGATGIGVAEPQLSADRDAVLELTAGADTSDRGAVSTETLFGSGDIAPITVSNSQTYPTSIDVTGTGPASDDGQVGATADPESVGVGFGADTGTVETTSSIDGTETSPVVETPRLLGSGWPAVLDRTVAIETEVLSTVESTFVEDDIGFGADTGTVETTSSIDGTETSPVAEDGSLTSGRTTTVVASGFTFEAGSTVRPVSIATLSEFGSGPERGVLTADGLLDSIGQAPVDDDGQVSVSEAMTAIGTGQVIEASSTNRDITIDTTDVGISTESPVTASISTVEWDEFARTGYAGDPATPSVLMLAGARGLNVSTRRPSALQVRLDQSEQRSRTIIGADSGSIGSMGVIRSETDVEDRERSVDIDGDGRRDVEVLDDGT